MQEVTFYLLLVANYLPFPREACSYTLPRKILFLNQFTRLDKNKTGFFKIKING